MAALDSIVAQIAFWFEFFSKLLESEDCRTEIVPKPKGITRILMRIDMRPYELDFLGMLPTLNDAPA